MANKRNLVTNFLVEVAAGVTVSAIGVYFISPETSVELSVLAVGLISIPIFMFLGAAAVFLYGLYLVVKVLDWIATHLGLFDVDDFS